MSNLGLQVALAESGMGLCRPVGDELNDGGCSPAASRSAANNPGTFFSDYLFTAWPLHGAERPADVARSGDRSPSWQKTCDIRRSC
jgi:hypothetical protein